MSLAPVTFELVEVPTKNGTRRVVAATPTALMEYGRERLDAMQRGDWWTPVDHAIIHNVRADAEPVHAVVLCARSAADDQRWRFRDDLADEDCARLAALLLRGHAMMCKELAPQGMFSVFMTGLRGREQTAYERGAEMVADKLEGEMRHADPAARPSLRLDQWLVERQTVWSAMPMAEFAQDKLPGLLTTGERQYRQLRRMVGRLVTRPF